MTRVDFYVCDTVSRRDHDILVCRLTEKAWRQGHRVHLHCLDAERLAEFDELLWTFHDISFVPHAIAGAGATEVVKVTLACDEQPPACADVLINLHRLVPPYFSQFERVIETTGEDSTQRQAARERYRFYQDRGYALNTHKIDTRDA